MLLEQAVDLPELLPTIAVPQEVLPLNRAVQELQALGRLAKRL